MLRQLIQPHEIIYHDRVSAWYGVVIGVLRIQKQFIAALFTERESAVIPIGKTPYCFCTELLCEV